jgi:hypothetical protein
MLWARDPLAHPLGHTGAGPGSAIAIYGQGRRVCALWQASPSTPEVVVDEVFKRLAGAGTDNPPREGGRLDEERGG